MADAARRAVPRERVRFDPDRQGWLVLAQARRLSGAGLSGGRRLHGPRQLGDLARWRFQIRLRAARRCADLQHHGHRVAGVVRTAWRRFGPRSGAGLPRRLPEGGVVAAVAIGRNRDQRDRPRVIKRGLEIR